MNLSLPLKKREKRVRWTRYLDYGPYLSLNKSSKNFTVIYNWHTLIVLMMVFVLSFLFVSLFCGAVLARNSSIIFSEFRSFSNSSSLSTCFSWGFALCLWNPFFLDECLVWSAEIILKKHLKQGIKAHIYHVEHQLERLAGNQIWLSNALEIKTNWSGDQQNLNQRELWKDAF